MQCTFNKSSQLFNSINIYNWHCDAKLINLLLIHLQLIYCKIWCKLFQEIRWDTYWIKFKFVISKTRISWVLIWLILSGILSITAWLIIAVTTISMNVSSTKKKNLNFQMLCILTSIEIIRKKSIVINCMHCRTWQLEISIF